MFHTVHSENSKMKEHDLVKKLQVVFSKLFTEHKCPGAFILETTMGTIVFGTPNVKRVFNEQYRYGTLKEDLAKENLFIEVQKKKYPASIILKPLNSKNIRSI